MKSKVLSGVVAVIMSMCLLTGCGGKMDDAPMSSPDTATTAPSADADVFSPENTDAPSASPSATAE